MSKLKPTQSERILTLLQQNPKGITSTDLRAMNIYQYTARLTELRAAGHDIRAEHIKDGLWRYTLVRPTGDTVYTDVIRRNHEAAQVAFSQTNQEPQQ